MDIVAKNIEQYASLTQRNNENAGKHDISW